MSDHFERTFLGLQARQDYRVINLWQVDVSIVFNQSISTLLPFVPILQGGSEPEMVLRAMQQLRAEESLSELEPLLGFFASFVLDTELVSQILRWDMAILRESPWYQEILQEGEQKGEQKGLDHERSLILRQLNRRIGMIDPQTETQILSLSWLQLESLGEALLDFSRPSDLRDWLHSQTNL